MAAPMSRRVLKFNSGKGSIALQRQVNPVEAAGGEVGLFHAQIDAAAVAEHQLEFFLLYI